MQNLWNRIMDKQTIKISVIKYLEANHGKSWAWGGQISRAVHEETGHKESVIERHGLRKLREAGILDVDYAQVDGSGPKCSRYRLKPLEAFSPSQEIGIDYDNIYDALGRPDLKPIKCNHKRTRICGIPPYL